MQRRIPSACVCAAMLALLSCNLEGVGDSLRRDGGVRDAGVADGGANPCNTVVCQALSSCHDVGVCDPATGQCSNPVRAEGAPCDDGNACTRSDFCNGGTCVGSEPVQCTTSDQCHTAGTCDPMTGACSNPPKTNDAPCNDGNACTQSDTCQSGVCVGANPKTCTASDQCHTAGTCDPMTGACSNPPKMNDAPCSDGNACTQSDTCQFGVCVGANPKTCTASDQCHTAGSCDPMTGACSNPSKMNDAPCNDGNACTQSDTCQFGACVGANPKTCTASDQCHTAGTCDPMTGACSNPPKTNDTPCNDGNACTQSDTCQFGACVGANPKTCTASDQCHTAGTCDPMTGACSNPPKTNDTPCSDGNACTQSDTCQFGACVGANPKTCTASDQCHTAGTCDPMTGACSNPTRTNGAPCSDGDACTQSDTCQFGACVGANPKTCTVSDQCHTAGTCDPMTGACSNPTRTNGAPCSDGDACTQSDTCQFGACVGANPKICTVSDQCHSAGTCDPMTGACSNPTRTNGAPCSDGDACTQSDTCQFGACVGANPKICTVSDQCHTAGTCDPMTGACGNPPKTNGSPCEDGDACTMNDTCQFGACVGGGSVACIPPNPCQVTVDCAPTIGDCEFTPRPDGVFAGTINTTCGVGACARAGRTECLGGQVVDTCEAGDPAPSDLSCNNVDDDCNGPRDDGYVSLPTTCGFGICQSTGQTSCVGGGVQDSCVPRCQPTGTFDNPGTTCKNVLDTGGSQGTGNYWLRRSGGEKYLTYCDMTTDGGGWTSVFIGKNGRVNVFDYFDEGSYMGVFEDPSMDKYLQRAPAALGNSAAEIAVSCGGAMVAFAMTQPVQNWLIFGVQSGWQKVTPRVLTPTIPAHIPNSVYTGATSNPSFVFSRNNLAGASTFASSYSPNTGFDYCNNVADTTSIVRVFYREVSKPRPRNTPETAARSCRAVQLAGDAYGDGIYWLMDPVDGPYQAYCDMTTDGGGWTAAFAGRNGSTNVFDHFDSPTYQGGCSDASTHCLRRAPQFIKDSAGEIAVSCGGAMIAFAATQPTRAWLADGTRSGFTALTPRLISGDPPAYMPNSLFTGNADNDLSFVFTRNNLAGASVFASSYSNSEGFDYCNNTFDQASPMRVFYREAAPTPVYNTPASARLSCRAILLAGESQGDGVYYLAQSGVEPYPAYCDMTSDGGGWTAAFAGYNGSTNVFSHFDADPYADICPDAATHCLRRAPGYVKDSATEIAVSCGGAMVAFAGTQNALKWLADGAQSGFGPLTPRVLTPQTIGPHVPNSLFTGDAPTNYSFVFTRNNLAGASVFASSYGNNTGADHCNNVPDQASLVRVFYRESAPIPVYNTPGDARRSCLAILLSGQSLGDGIYWLKQQGVLPYQAYCDMTSDGGGWTTAFAGINGSTNVFGYFDQPSYEEVSTDPATHYLRRAPALLRDSAAELAVTCGTNMAAFAMTQAAQDWLIDGTQRGWIKLTPRIVSGDPSYVPNSMFTGESATHRGFVVSRNSLAGASVFASSYSNNAGSDYCANQFDQSSPLRLMYREVAPTPIHNAPEGALRTCRETLAAHSQAQSGIYWLKEATGQPYTAYCDMTSDGGGWTAAFSGRNGSTNVFDHFDSPTYAGACTDPASHCLRRAPASLSNSAGDLAVSCGDAMVKFAMTEAARVWLQSGTRAPGWQPLTPTLISGEFNNTPNSLFTGVDDTDMSFVVSRNNLAGASVFASSYSNNEGSDYCANVVDQASMARVYHREVAPTAVLNTLAMARSSCRAILRANESAGDGLYYITTDASLPYLAYCDMTSDGGGWTALFVGRNGSPNVFDRFDAGGHTGICPDAGSRCLRRAPTTLGTTHEIAARCGGSMVAFNVSTAVRDYLVSGTSSGWQPLTPRVITAAPSNVPNSLYTGDGASNPGFVVSRNNLAGASTFASSYNNNVGYDYCANSPNAASFVRLFYREP